MTTKHPNQLVLYTRDINACPFCFVIQAQLKAHNIEYTKVVGTSPNGFVPSLEYNEHFSIDHDAESFLINLLRIGITHIFKDQTYKEELIAKYNITIPDNVPT